MFDWPEPSHTSPSNTSLNSTVLAPLTVSVKGPPAFIGSSLSDHFPSLLAVADFDWSPMVTVTFSAGSAQPQTGSGVSRCSTM